MNHISQNEKFQQIWEFRSGDDDRDTSDDSISMNPTGELGHEKPKLDSVLRENDEETGTATCQKPDDASNVVEAVKTAKKKTKARSNKTSKKSNEVKTNKGKSISMKRRKVTRNSGVKQARMFEDLKIFASSLIDELKVAREQMFGRWKEEMEKLVECRPTQTRVVLADKSTTPIQKGTDSSVQPQNHSEGEKGTKRAVASNVHANSEAMEVAAELDQATDLMSNKQLRECIRGRLPMNVEGKNTDQFGQHLNLPTFVPTPQAQSRRNGIRLDGGSPVGAPENKGDGLWSKQLDPRISYHGVPAFQTEIFRSFHQLIPKGVGFSDQNNSPISSKGVGFPTPVPHGLAIGSSMAGSSNIPSQYYSDSPLQTQSRAALMVNTKFPGGSALSSEEVLRSCLTNNVLQRNGGDSAQSQSQLMNNSQFFPKFLFDK